LEKFLCINNKSIDPYFNLALEEYFLKSSRHEIFILWQNEPCVVVGKHQNALAEINKGFVKNNHIKVARRLSGGGTVFHDLGNLNFTYIMNGSEGKMINFIKYTDDILEVLNNLGVAAYRNHRNDLVINNKKISGNAEHIFKNRVIHHGTLLFNADLSLLEDSIKPDEALYEDKSVQSVRSAVTNISEHMGLAIDLEQFRQILFNFVISKYSHSKIYKLREEDYSHIYKLRNEKYSTWEWVYGYSPKFKVRKTALFQDIKIEIDILIKRGYIDSLTGNKAFADAGLLKILTDFLVGVKYGPEEISERLNQSEILLSKLNFKKDFLINLLF